MSVAYAVSCAPLEHCAPLRRVVAGDGRQRSALDLLHQAREVERVERRLHGRELVEDDAKGPARKVRVRGNHGKLK